MMQAVVNRRRVMVVLAVVVLLVSVAWVGVAQRASAQTATPVVYVATGENFPDALGASAAAAVQGGPVLLVTKTSIPTETKTELNRLNPNVIYVAGGTFVVSDAVVDQLKNYAPSVIRVWGGNRYATAAAVSKSAFPVSASGGGDLSALTAAVNALTAKVDALEADNAALEGEVDALNATLAGVSRNGDTLLFTGMNLQVVNGTGTTNGLPNSLGNLIIGYNEDEGDAETRTGSHYLIVGDEHSWSFFGGIVSGFSNTSNGPYASVLGGNSNTASGEKSSVLGGNSNTASALWSSVSGGQANTASGPWSSVSGGSTNTASGSYASILGGNTRGVSGSYGTYPFCGC